MVRFTPISLHHLLIFEVGTGRGPPQFCPPQREMRVCRTVYVVHLHTNSILLSTRGGLRLFCSPGAGNRKHPRGLSHNFIDLKKAFNRVLHPGLWQVLRNSFNVEKGLAG